MKTILFTWNPKKWRWANLPQAVCEANEDGFHRIEWSCGVARYIRAGDRAFLMRLGEEPKGLMGSGVVVSEPEEGSHWDEGRAEKGDTVFRVEIVFDVLNDLPILPHKELRKGLLGTHNWVPQASGTRIPDNVATALEARWEELTGVGFIPPTREEIPTLYSEGTRRTRLIKTYERSTEAVEECKKHHGTSCSACGLSMEQRYGDIGAGFIHVHHLEQIAAKRGRTYEVDPVKDLVPLCPNCHAMVHRRTPPLTVEQLKQRLK